MHNGRTLSIKVEKNNPRYDDMSGISFRFNIIKLCIGRKKNLIEILPIFISSDCVI